MANTRSETRQLTELVAVRLAPADLDALREEASDAAAGPFVHSGPRSPHRRVDEHPVAGQSSSVTSRLRARPRFGRRLRKVSGWSRRNQLPRR